MMPQPLTAFALALSASGLLAQRPAPPTPPTNGAPAAAARPSQPADPTDPKPYDKVITSEARTQDGFLKVHQLKGKVYFEIPKVRLGQDLLLVVTANRVPAAVDHAGKVVDQSLVRWVLKDQKVLLESVSHALVADPSQPVAAAVAANNTNTIVQSFPVETLAKDGSPVIDVTRLFTTEVPDFSARQLLGAQMFDASRSFVDRVKVFPANLNVEAVQTYSAAPASPGASAPSAGGIRPGTSGTITMFYSFIQLPEQPMLPRLFDERVAYFNFSNMDFGRSEPKAVRRTYIAKWRLEKKDPAATVSEPVKPITFYIDRATPSQWVPFIKQGVEAWQTAFEAAGFKQAIVAKLAPTKEEDPDFDAGDVRYSVIRWVPSSIANAYGPHISDPRTGEIIEADIVLYHNILQLQRDWYFTQVGHLDPRAQQPEMPEALIGQLLGYVVTHEVGHTLGLPHNFKASSLYPFEKVRDKAWVKKMGHVPTLMDYSRFNYVVQPEDGFDLADLIPKIGPYDTFAIKWGYTPIPAAKTSDDEKPVLNDWLKEQETTPWLRYSTAGAAGVDPGDQAEAVGDADAVKATRLGTKNLQRTIALLPKVALTPGKDHQELAHLYDAIWGQWRRELGHVVPLVGGYDSENKHGGQDGGRFTPVPKARQAEAVRFLNDALFKTPVWILDPTILAKLGPGGGQMRLLSAQRGVLAALLNRARLSRLDEQEAMLGAQAYTLPQLLADLRTGLFSELLSSPGNIELSRRSLQRAYVEELGNLLNQPAMASSAMGGLSMTMLPANALDGTRAVVRAELRTLQTLAAKPTSNKALKAHLEDLKDQIGKVMDPKFAPVSGSSAPGQPTRRLHDNCWPGHCE